MRIILLLTIFILLNVSLPSSVLAISCHCFQDRTFNPQKPSASDAYFLATVQNSLMATAFDVPKSAIVKAKMGGVDADLLWVVYYVSDRTGITPEELLTVWADAGLVGIFEKLSQIEVKFDPPFLHVLNPASRLQDLSRCAYFSVMTVQLGFDIATLERLEIATDTRQQHVMAIFLSLLLGEEPTGIFRSVANGELTWSEALASTGLDPEQIGPSWQKLFKLHQMGL